jgi:hypothetical protein
LAVVNRSAERRRERRCHSSIREEIRTLDRVPAWSGSATTASRLLAGANQVIGKRPRGRIVGTGVAPEFMPKHNCADIGNRDQTADDAAPLEIGDEQVHGGEAHETCIRARAGVERYRRGLPSGTRLFHSSRFPLLAVRQIRLIVICRRAVARWVVAL